MPPAYGADTSCLGKLSCQIKVWGESLAVHGKMLQLERIRRYKAKHKLLGLCVMCSRKATDGFLRCRVCRARERELRMARHPLFCSECRKIIRPEERDGRRFHKSCAQRRRARNYPQQHRSAAVAYQRRHKEMGLCSNCPRKAVRGGLCARHYRMVKERIDRAAGRIGESVRRY